MLAFSKWVTMTKLPTGSGIYIWEAHKIFGGDVAKIVDACKEAGLGHVFLKVADGPYSYPPACATIGP